MKRFLNWLAVSLFELESHDALEKVHLLAGPISMTDQCLFHEVIREVRSSVMNQHPIPSRTVMEYERIRGKYAMLGLPPHFPYLDRWSVPYFCDLCLLACSKIESRETL